MAVERNTLDLNASFVIEKELTVGDIRSMQEETMEDVSTWLDEAQGKVFSGESDTAYLVIKVTRN